MRACALDARAQWNGADARTNRITAQSLRLLSAALIIIPNRRKFCSRWGSESSSDSDEPVSRAALKARSSDVIKRGMVIPRLSFSTECLRTPRTARQNCGLPATIAGRLPGCEQSLFMQRSARMRANFEDSESSDDSADSSPRSDESDCDWTPDRKTRMLQPNSVPSLNLK